MRWEDPREEEAEIDLGHFHLAQSMPFSIPSWYESPNDDA
jgi:hypothetical protein